MGVGMSGMVSGLDTDSIVKAMVSSYTSKEGRFNKRTDKTPMENGRMEES